MVLRGHVLTCMAVLNSSKHSTTSTLEFRSISRSSDRMICTNSSIPGLKFVTERARRTFAASSRPASSSWVTGLQNTKIAEAYWAPALQRSSIDRADPTRYDTLFSNDDTASMSLMSSEGSIGDSISTLMSESYLGRVTRWEGDKMGG